MLDNLKSGIFTTMGLSDDTNINDASDLFSDESEESGLQLYEIFFAGSGATEADDLVYKDIMREGEWAYRPGPGQKPTPIPLKVVPGNAQSDTEIGMSDLVDAFNDKAIDHVTIPTSHDDKPHENTGYVERLSIEKDEEGKAVLRAGLKFTEPDIKEKALRGSIANTSAGIIFDYIKKDTGKKFRQALGHVALTNKPWLNGMKPFGIMASEDYSDEEFEITPLILADVVWNQEDSLSWLRDNVNKAINDGRDERDILYVTDITKGKALVTKFDNRGGTDNNFVVPFQVRSGSVKIPSEDKWIQASREWVNASLSEEKSFQEFYQDLGSGGKSLSEEAPNKAAVREAKNPTGGNDMADENKEKETVGGAPSNDPAQVTDLSEERVNELREEFTGKLSEKDAENERLRAKVHAMEVKERISELKKAGFSEAPGLLAEIQNIMLADKGGDVITLTLSEEGKSDEEVTLSATDVVNRIVDALPKTDAGSLKFGEQHLEVEAGEEPPAKSETNLSEEESTRALADGLGLDINLPKAEKDGDA